VSERVTIEVPGWVADLTDRGVQAAVILAAVAAGGLGALAVTWSGVAATLSVWIQLPFVVSGAFGGMAVTGTALGLMAVHLERRSAASDRSQLELAIESAGALALALPDRVRGRRPTAPTYVRNRRTLHRADCRFAVDRDWPPARLDGDLKPCGVCRPLGS
jgi:hypothetical protein